MQTQVGSIWYIYGDPDTRFKVTEIGQDRIHFDVFKKEGKCWLKINSGSSDRSYWNAQIDDENMFEVK